jgi:hypothetical protein
MMSDKTKSVRCVRDWRDFTLDYYRLPRDGRQWRAQASKRRQLAEYLATFANGDGTRIEVGIERICDKFEPAGRSTVFRWLDDLRELRALAPKSGLTGRYGTAVRELTIDAFESRYEAYLQSEEAMQDESYRAYIAAKSQSMESQTGEHEVPKSQVMESQSQVMESQSRREFGTQPSLDRLTAHPNRPPNSALGVSEEDPSPKSKSQKQATVNFGK